MGYQVIIDTSNKYLAVGIADDNKVLSKTQYYAWQRQSELCIQEIENQMQSLKIDAKDIVRVIVARGPGSYTGVRIALTIAKTMAFALNIPVCAFSSMAAIAGAEGSKIVLIDARSHRAYLGIYQNGKEVVADSIINLDNIDSIYKQYPNYTLVGDVDLLGQEKQEIDIIENMFDLGHIYENVENTFALVPQYLKD